MAEKTDAKSKNGKKAKNAKNAVVAPSKKTMNFARHESNVDPRRVAIIVGVVVVVLAVFAKFGILDPLEEKRQAYQELGVVQDQQTALQQKLVKYDEVSREYGRYSYGWMTEIEVSTVNRIEILDILEREIFPYSTVEDLTIIDNVLTVNARGITLEQASEIIMSMEEDGLVQNAQVFYAESEEYEKPLVSMTIILAKEEPEA